MKICLSVFANDDLEFPKIGRINLTALAAIGRVVPNSTPIPSSITCHLVGYPFYDDPFTGQRGLALIWSPEQLMILYLMLCLIFALLITLHCALLYELFPAADLTCLLSAPTLEEFILMFSHVLAEYLWATMRLPLDQDLPYTRTSPILRSPEPAFLRALG